VINAGGQEQTAGTERRLFGPNIKITGVFRDTFHFFADDFRAIAERLVARAAEKLTAVNLFEAEIDLDFGFPDRE